MDIAQRKRTNRKPCKSGVYVQDVTLKELLSLTHLPSHQAAQALGLGITVSQGPGRTRSCFVAAPAASRFFLFAFRVVFDQASYTSHARRSRRCHRPLLYVQVFKRVCRREGLTKWPYIKPCFRLEAGQHRSDQVSTARHKLPPGLRVDLAGPPLAPSCS